jgi:hypothetical protein
MDDDGDCRSRLRTSTCDESAIEQEAHVEAVLAVVTHAKERWLHGLDLSDEPVEVVADGL